MSRKISPQNILQHELIGLPVKIIRSLNSSQLGTEGKVCDETMRTLVIMDDSRRRVIPKTGTLFQFTLEHGVLAEVKGDHILRRPEDRVKVRQRRPS